MIFSIHELKEVMPMFKMFGQRYTVTTKKGVAHQRLRIFVEDLQTGELLPLHDVSLKGTSLTIYDTLKSLGKLKDDDDDMVK